MSEGPCTEVEGWGKQAEESSGGPSPHGTGRLDYCSDDDDDDEGSEDDDEERIMPPPPPPRGGTTRGVGPPASARKMLKKIQAAGPLRLLAPVVGPLAGRAGSLAGGGAGGVLLLPELAEVAGGWGHRRWVPRSLGPGEGGDFGGFLPRVVARACARLPLGGCASLVGGATGHLPSTRGGAEQRHATGRCRGGRASEAGHTRPSHAHRALAPSRRTCGVRTPSPGRRRGCTAWRAVAAVPQRSCPTCPARQCRPMPYGMATITVVGGGSVLQATGP